MKEQPRWLDQPRNVRRIVYVLYAVCLGLLVAELFVHRHADFGVQGWFGFYAAFGFLAYCGIVNAAKVLRRLLRRPEDYYLPDDDRDENEGNG